MQHISGKIAKEGIVFKKTSIRGDFWHVELPKPRRRDVVFHSVFAKKARYSIYLPIKTRKKLLKNEDIGGVFVHLPKTEWEPAWPRHFLGGFQTVHHFNFSHLPSEPTQNHDPKKPTRIYQEDFRRSHSCFVGSVHSFHHESS